MKQRETVFFLGSKITADGDCSHEIKRHLHLGRKAMTNLHSILKSRDMIISIDAEKAFDKVQHSFMIKILQKAGMFQKEHTST